MDPRRTALLIVDVQERLAPAMFPADAAACEKNIGILVEAARRLGVPIVVSEQYKKGLGNTLPSIDRALADTHVIRFEKLEFSAVDAPGFVAPFDALTADGRDEWIVTGMETHICVWLTARGLRQKGAKVNVVADAVASRTAENRRLGLELCQGQGASIVPTETVVFDLLKKAGSEDFKALSRLIK